MNEYTFSTLNDKDFENISRDLLSAHLKLDFKTFKSGRDKGIDCRYSTAANDNEVIVQAKHYLKSGSKKLIRDLREKELPKVKKLNPRRYIVITSVELSPAETEEIKKIFEGYIISLQDIYSNSDINTLISKYPEIEIKNIKLWLSSVNVLDNLLNKEVRNRTFLLREEIEEKVSIYVQNSSHLLAYNRLLENRVLIITGTPGVGKTTLCEILMLMLIGNFDTELIEIDTDINDAYAMVDFQSDRHQTIYFDDFLGSNILEAVSYARADSSIVKFIKRIKNSRNKFLILSSRTTILNQAKLRYENLNRSGLSEMHKFVLDVSYLSEYDKAKILYNHLYFYCGRNKYFDRIIEGEFYSKIIDHPNYSPRIIEYITSEVFLRSTSVEDYRQSILGVLDEPTLLWGYSYDFQIGKNEKLLLQVIYSFANEVEIGRAKEAFLSLLSIYSDTEKEKLSDSVFKNALNVLLNGYVNSTVRQDDGKNFVSFSNPSIADFIKSRFDNDFQLLFNLLQSVLNADQLKYLYRINNNAFSRLKKQNIKLLISHNFENFKKQIEIENYEELVKLLECSFEIFDNDLLFEYVNILSKDIYVKIKGLDYQLIYNIIGYSFAFKKLREIVLNVWDTMIVGLYSSAKTIEDISSIYSLFDLYEVDFELWTEDEYIINSIEYATNSFVRSYVTSELEEKFYEYEFDAILKDSYYDQEYGLYIEDYNYELRTSLEDVTSSILDEFYKESGLSCLEFSHSSTEFELDYYKSRFEERYESNLQDQAMEDYKMRRSSSSSTSSSWRSDDSISDLFE